MTTLEFSDLFDLHYNNIMSNQAPGLDEYEKSVFLTKALDEILKSYFNPKLNKPQDGFDGSERRLIDFSNITRLAVIPAYADIKNKYYLPYVTRWFVDTNNTKTIGEYLIENNIARELWVEVPIDLLKYHYQGESDLYVQPLNGGKVFLLRYTGEDVEQEFQVTEVQIKDCVIFDKNGSHSNIRKNYGSSFDSRSIFSEMPKDILMILNERAIVLRNNSTKAILSIVPIQYKEYDRLMSKPYKRPLKNQAWRLISNESKRDAYLILGPLDVLLSYNIRYVICPTPIILQGLGAEGLSIGGYYGTDEDGNLVSVNQTFTPDEGPFMATQGIDCQLDPILHEEILQRAVELAKAAYTGDLLSQVMLGLVSETEKGIVTRQ